MSAVRERVLGKVCRLCKLKYANTGQRLGIAIIDD
jgi:hypothetical protein